MQILTNIDLARNEIQNARIQNLTIPPSSPPPGLIYFNSVDKILYSWDGSVWKNMFNMSVEEFITALTASSQKISDSNLSANANDAINKRHSHTNQDILDAMTAAFTTAEKVKLNGIATGASKTEKSTTNGNIKNNDIEITVYTHPTTHPASMITGLNTVATSGNYNDLSNRPSLGTVASKNTGTTNGTVPIIGSDGKLDSSIMPALVITDTFVVSTQAAMLALNVQVGDIAVRTDLNSSYILKSEPASTLSNWQELLSPLSDVRSVNGKTGTVVLAKSDIGLSLVDNVKQATKTEFDTHDNDSTKHITSVERTKWNDKTSKFSTTIGNGSLTTFTVNHALATQDVTVTVRRASTPFDVVFTDIEVIDINNIRLLFGSAPTSNQYRVTVTG